MLPEVVIACVLTGLVLGLFARAWALIAASFALALGMAAHWLASAQPVLTAVLQLIAALTSLQVGYLVGALLLVPAARLLCRSGSR